MGNAPRTRNLLHAVSEFIERFVILPDENAVLALSLFVLHTWVIEAAEATPYFASMGSVGLQQQQKRPRATAIAGGMAQEV